MTSKRILVIAAWLIMLAVSDLPDIIITWLGGSIPPALFWAKTGFLALILAVTVTVPGLRTLWQYALALLILFLALGLTNTIRQTNWFQDRFNYPGVSYFIGFAAVMALDLFVALVMIAGLWLMKRRRAAFFLTLGQMDTPIKPIRILGIKPGESWKQFTWIFAAAAGLGVFIPTILTSPPTGAAILRALPLFPAAILFAAVNAFTEETYFRASLLSTLHETIGRSQTLLLTLTFFGLSHWLYGSPGGILGFLMTGFLAWLMGRSMLETKGMLSPWIIHFIPDVVVFISYALLFVQS